LGFTAGAYSVTGNQQVPNSFSYDNVECMGTENTLDECPHLNSDDCGESEGVRVACVANCTRTSKL